MKCPHCHAQIADGLDYCPHCQQSVSGESRGSEAQSTRYKSSRPTRGSSSSEQQSFSEGSTLGRYTLRTYIGSGGTGQVYKAVDEFERSYALKILPVVGDDTYRAIEREFEARRKINDFTHVVRAYQPELLEFEDESYILYPIEYLPTTLEAGRQNLLNMPPGRRDKVIRKDIMPQICHGIQECHEAGILHLDLKPSNILYDVENGNYKVTDFGISRVMSEQEGRATTSIIVEGTIAYMAPEQMAGARVDERTDIYALGVLLNALYYGSELPGEGDEASALIDEIVDRCTERAPAKRFSAVSEIRDALRKPATNNESQPSQAPPQAPSSENEPFRQLLGAIQQGDLDAVRKMVGEDKKLLRVADNSQRTALHHAIERKVPVIADFLMEAGSNPDHQDIHGETPLHKAVRGNLASTTMNLLLHYADQQIENDEGKRPASYAQEKEVKTILDTYKKRAKKKRWPAAQGENQNQNQPQDPDAIGWPFAIVMLGIMAGAVLIFYFFISLTQ